MRQQNKKWEVHIRWYKPSISKKLSSRTKCCSWRYKGKLDRNKHIKIKRLRHNNPYIISPNHKLWWMIFIFKAFDKRVWNSTCTSSGVCFSYLSPEGEEEYPGKWGIFNWDVCDIYNINKQNQIRTYLSSWWCGISVVLI